MEAYGLLSGSLVQISSKVRPQFSPGCSGCPLDNKPGIRKIKGLTRIGKKRIFVFAMCPGRTENEEGLELVGKSGRLFWKELAAVGYMRDDCDVQNIVRCWSCKEDPETGRIIDVDPSKEAIRHCSRYTERALELNDGHAKVYLVLGKVAAQTLLGKEYKKDSTVLWSTRLNAKVLCLDHPSYFLHGAPPHRLETFRQQLASIPKILAAPERFSVLTQNDYAPAVTIGEVEQVLADFRAYLATSPNPQASLDIETDIIDGKPVLVMVGFSWKKGLARSIVVEHPEAPSKSRVEAVKRLLTRFFASVPASVWIMQHGGYDVNKLYGFLGVRIEYDWDTTYSAYFQHPDWHAYGLADCVRRLIPEFVGYKDVLAPYLKRKDIGYSQVPIPILAQYNGADCDVTRRLKFITAKGIEKRLVKIYTHAGMELDKMEDRGPILDYAYHDQVAKALPPKIKSISDKLKLLAGDPNFNPGSPEQVAKVIYETLDLPVVSTDKYGNPVRDTAKETLEILSGKHKFPRLILDWRRLSKMKSTYLTGYKTSADLHGGELRTKWWLTGTVTGRMSSGAGRNKQAAEKGLVNLQNLHGSPMLKNLLVSDKRWHIILENSGDAHDIDAIDELFAFLMADYSQMELRVLALVSGDELLIKQFNSGVDIHCLVGAELTGWTPEQIKNDPETRKLVKNLHFGIIYGLTESSLYDYLIAKGVTTVTKKRAAELHRRYFQVYKGVARFVKRQLAFAEKYGYVETLLGHRRYLGAWDDSRDTFWGNQSLNTPIQGTAHQLLLCALAIIHNDTEGKYNRLHKPLMEIHDALAFRVRTKHLAEAAEQIKHLLQVGVPEYFSALYNYKLPIPFVCDVAVGYRLGTMVKDYEPQPSKKFIAQWIKVHKEIDAKIAKEYPECAIAS